MVVKHLRLNKYVRNGQLVDSWEAHFRVCEVFGPEACDSVYCRVPECVSYKKEQRRLQELKFAKEWQALVTTGEYEVRSRSECGGVLVLYQRTNKSPTGVLSQGMITDNHANRVALELPVYMGAY